ncbi:MAG: tRNA glutamyl-Q(34) synthetase GluQRS [Granulosicoccus sp.]
MKRSENVKPPSLDPSGGAQNKAPSGRFAPSPTGDLHFGSLLAAVASYCEARSKEALWYLRIDDIDLPRSVPGSAERIQHSLRRYGLYWDGDIHWQSRRNSRYRQALARLIELGLVFSCGCSRRSLPPGQIYPGTCRANRLRTIEEPVDDRALRIVLPEHIEFNDGVQGLQSLNLTEQVGDVVIWRRDKLVSYTLACAIDDAMDCTEVVRGADLLPSTAAQHALINYLSLIAPAYAHIPVAADANNDKLSKHSRAASIDSMNPVPTLHAAWRFLGQSAFAAETLEEFWTHAIGRWQLQRVPASLRKVSSTDGQATTWG